VFDTDIDTQHPDLPNIVPGKNFINGSNNVYDNGVNSGHGTAVAKTAAAAGNNGVGVSGVSWKNSIMPLVVIDPSGYSPYSVIATAINYAADHGAKVINMSLAGSSHSSTLQNAVNYAWNKGAVIVAAGANNEQRAGVSGGSRQRARRFCHGQIRQACLLHKFWELDRCRRSWSLNPYDYS
jgi:thermitase